MSMTTEYKVVQIKNKKIYILGAGFTAKRQAMDYLINKQRDGLRGMSVITTKPYAKGMTEVVYA